jgi:glycosyltransferase involved in cell wall biosynthesis
MSAVHTSDYLNRTNLYHITHFVRSYGLRSSVHKVKDYLLRNRRYAAWLDSNRITAEEAQQQKVEERQFPQRPLISILVPTYQTAPEYLRQMIESVIGQTYTNWELCIADGSPDHDEIKTITEGYRHPQIRYRALEKNLGISGNTNAALEMASGAYIALLDHDDYLEKNALFELVRAINHASIEPDALYTDEDMFRSGKTPFFHNPAFKPDFNADYLRSCNYITHFFVVRRELAQKAGGFSSDCDGSQDYDFILKTTGQARQVLHIPKVLYHWRVHQNSVAGNPEDKMYAYESAVKALNRHYERTAVPAHAEKDTQLGFYRTIYDVQGEPAVSIILRNCAPELKQALQEQISYPNYEIIDHASEAKGSYLLFLNGIGSISLSSSRTALSGRALGKDIISLMLGNCQRADVGAVGVKITGKGSHVSECGLYYTKEGTVYSPFRGLLSNEPGYYGLAEVQHFTSLIGPACFMVPREELAAFRDSGTTCHDVYHLCLELLEKGLHITVLPYIQASLKTTKKRQERKNTIPVFQFKERPEYIKKHPCDPCYTPNFSQKTPYELQ